MPDTAMHDPSECSSRGGYPLVFVATLLFYGAYYAILIPLPLYLTGIPLPDTQVSLVLGAFGLASLFGRPMAGVLTDSWGRKPIMLAGAVSLFIGAVGVSFTTSPVVLFILRLFQALGHVGFTTASLALVCDLCPVEKRASVLAVFGTAANLAMSLVPAAVNALLGVLTIKGGLWLSGGLAACAGILALCSREPAVDRCSFAWSSVIELPSRLFMPMLAGTLLGAGHGAFLQFLPILSQRRSLGFVGLAFTVYGVSIILTRLGTGRLLDGEIRLRIGAGAFVALALAMVGFAFATTSWMLYASAALVGLATGILHPVLLAVHVDLLPDNRGRGVSDFYLAFDLGLGLGAWVMAPSLDRFGLTGLYLTAAVLSLLGVAVMLKIRARRGGGSPGQASVTSPSRR